jgi:hypothetical protein
MSIADPAQLLEIISGVLQAHPKELEAYRLVRLQFQLFSIFLYLTTYSSFPQTSSQNLTA